MSELVASFGAALSDGLVFLVYGAVVICLGLLSRAAGDRWPVAARSLGGKLVAWNAAPAGGVADVERQIKAYYRSLASSTTIVTGVAIVLGGVALALLARSGHPVSVGAGATWIAWLAYPAALFGTGLGFPLAVHLDRRSSPAGPRYADLRRRRLEDYRAPGLGWLAPAAVAVQAAAGLTMLAVEHVWLPAVVSALAALTVVVTELQMWATARAPRMVVMADPATARRCDDFVRAGVVARLQSTLLSTVGLIAIVEGYVVAGPPHPRDAVTQIAGLACLLCSAACIFGAIGLWGLEERLGGRITGWWGRPMPE